MATRTVQNVRHKGSPEFLWHIVAGCPPAELFLSLRSAARMPRAEAKELENETFM